MGAAPRPGTTFAQRAPLAVAERNLDFFAGIRGATTNAQVANERLLSGEPSVVPHATEPVWARAHRYLYVVHDRDTPVRGGRHDLVDDVDSLVAEIAPRGRQARQVEETYSNCVRKVVELGADGNEIGEGSAPVETSSRCGSGRHAACIWSAALQ